MALYSSPMRRSSGARCAELAARPFPCETSAAMPLAYQSEFIELCVRLGVLNSAASRSKSGRESPYFFNAGLFSTGRRDRARWAGPTRERSWPRISTSTCCSAPPTREFPWSRTTAAALAEHQAAICRLPSIARRPRTTARAARSSAARLKGRVLIVDDVITAGTAIRESIEIIRAAGARPAGVLLALDRQERGPGKPACRRFRRSASSTAYRSSRSSVWPT